MKNDLKPISLKVSFESISNKTHEFKIVNDGSSFFEQQEKFLISAGFKSDTKNFSLFDNNSQKFVLISDVNSLKKEVTYCMKNCMEHAKSTILKINDVFALIDENILNKNLKHIEQLKGIVFLLENYFQIDGFSEEFISYDGIKKLVDIIEITEGNTKVDKN